MDKKVESAILMRLNWRSTDSDNNMGPISPYGPKEFGRLTEQDIFNESEKFMTEQHLCEKTDDIFLTLRRVIADINIYGHRHLLDHVRNTPDRAKKVHFLMHWRTLHLQNLDVLFQNLIRKKILRIDEEQHFTRIEMVDKHRHPRGRQLHEAGEELLRQGKVAVILFVGCTSGRGEEGFVKEFHKARASDTSLFEILMQRLGEIGDAYGCPPAYIFHSASSQAHISSFLKNFRFADRVRLCQQNTHPILNLNGNLCLKASDQPDVIELPCGSGDFYTASMDGENILDRLKREGVQFVACAESDNLLEMVVDPFLVGLAAEGEQEVVYKCTRPLDQKEKVSRRVVIQNGAPRADTPQTLNSFINYNHKYRAQNSENVLSSPVWMGSLVFALAPVATVLQGPNKPPTFPQAVNYIMKNMTFWSPIDTRMHVQESCYAFERETSDLFINSLFKTQAVFVSREEEYLQVLTEKKEFSWEKAYQEYINIKNKPPVKPFYERFQEEQAQQEREEKERIERQAKEKIQQELKAREAAEAREKQVREKVQVEGEESQKIQVKEQAIVETAEKTAQETQKVVETQAKIEQEIKEEAVQGKEQNGQ